jgi:hypothetical protein
LGVEHRSTFFQAAEVIFCDRYICIGVGREGYELVLWSYLTRYPTVSGGKEISIKCFTFVDMPHGLRINTVHDPHLSIIYCRAPLLVVCSTANAFWSIRICTVTRDFFSDVVLHPQLNNLRFYPVHINRLVASQMIQLPSAQSYE